MEENEYIDKGGSKEEEKPKKAARSSKKKTAKKPKKKAKKLKLPIVDSIKEKLEDKKVRSSIGVGLVLLSVYINHSFLFASMSLLLGAYAQL